MNDTPSADYDRPSKSHLKREMHARQALGKKLAELNNTQLARLDLGEGLLAAIRETQRISGHEARRRQLQYVGKLMRDVDFAALQAAYDDLLGATRESVALMHRCERLRDQLLEDDTALGDFIAQHPGIDIQWLRAKVRAARQERSAARPPRQSRELYKWLYTELKGAAPEDSQELHEPGDGPQRGARDALDAADDGADDAADYRSANDASDADGHDDGIDISADVSAGFSAGVSADVSAADSDGDGDGSAAEPSRGTRSRKAASLEPPAAPKTASRRKKSP